MSEHISGNKEDGEVCHSASIEKYNAIFSKPTSDELDGIVLTQSDYDLTRDIYLNDHVGGVSGCNRLPPKKSKLRWNLSSKKTIQSQLNISTDERVTPFMHHSL
ncbi:hypothetical protein ILYODFUR_036969 [Ilyodon furcidens]|uniref:Uncharacterized protein n=1 Tax=Ilyodon furcidens TaxID=33524 RepID=A0ABV0UBH4_9TELE